MLVIFFGALSSMMLDAKRYKEKKRVEKATYDRIGVLAFRH